MDRVKKELQPYIDSKVHEANVPSAKFIKSSEATLIRMEQDLQEAQKFLATRADAGKVGE